MNLTNIPTIYTATTENIKITVRPIYVDGESDAMARKFMFAYFIDVENNSAESVQLLRRHWFINHDGGRVEEVEGEGVVGKQPTIKPGESFESFRAWELFHDSYDKERKG